MALLLKYVILIGVICGVSFAAIAAEPERTMSPEEEYINKLAHRTTDAQRNGTTLAQVLQGSARSRVVGVEGVNYEINKTNNEPYLVCAFLDRTICDPDTNPNCPTTQTCTLHGSHVVLSCISVFSYEPRVEVVNSTEKIIGVPEETIHFQGCQERMAESKAGCGEHTCLNNGVKRKSRVRNCCCLTKNCNEKRAVRMLNPFYVDPDAEAEAEQLKNSTLNAPKIIELAPESEEEEEEEAELKTGGYSLSFVVYMVMLTACLSFAAATILIYSMCSRRRQQTHVKLETTNASAPLVLPTQEFEMRTRSPAKPTNSPILNGRLHYPAHYYPPELDTNNQNSTAINNISEAISDQHIIAHGRYGFVFRAKYTDPEGNEHCVAVKKHDISERPSYLAEKKIFDYFASLPKGYPSILKYWGSEEVGQELWIVTEYHERLSLYELIKRNTISLASAIRVILSMVDGLQFLHDDRPFFFGHTKPIIIHRDIKSKNILVRKDMTALIADFGLARKFEMRNPKYNDLLGQVGTRRYMSPEVLEGATEFTPCAFKQMDVYAMALVMWEVLSQTILGEEKVEEMAEYMLPYEDQVGMNPTIGQMREIVVGKRMRPVWRAQINRHPKSRVLRGIAEEMWDPEAHGRITAGCAFNRIVRMVVEDKLKRHIEDADCKEAMSAYHEDPENVPHPTPDPFEEQPEPPAYPDVDKLGIIGVDEIWDARDNGLKYRRGPEQIYDAALRRMLTEEEVKALATSGVYMDAEESSIVSSFEHSDF